MIVEGVVAKLDEPCSHGWAVPSSEVNNLTHSLAGAPVTICGRGDHSCGPHPHVIGSVISAWRSGDEVYARASITRSLGKSVLRGKIDRGWSLSMNASVERGFARDVDVLSLDIVKRPAYKEAGFVVVSALGDGKEGVSKTEGGRPEEFSGVLEKASNPSVAEGETLHSDDKLESARLMTSVTSGNTSANMTLTVGAWDPLREEWVV
ncbi:MAG: hypothetical protein ACXQS2_05325 [Methermicoccaceae archaeon]